MEFTKVIIPDRAAVDVYPWLYASSGSPLVMDNTTICEASDKLANSATADIEYDLAVYADGTNYNSKAFTVTHALRFISNQVRKREIPMC